MKVCEWEAVQSVALERKGLKFEEFWAAAIDGRHFKGLFVPFNANDRVMIDLDSSSVLKIKRIVLNNSTVQAIDARNHKHSLFTTVSHKVSEKKWFVETKSCLAAGHAFLVHEWIQNLKR